MTATRNKLYLLLAIALTAGYIWLFYNVQTGTGNTGVCIIKHVTSIPCPSCGATRSVMALLSGDFWSSLYWNPVGILLFLILTIMPLWLMSDVFFKKQTLFNFYTKAEKILQQKAIAIPAITLVIINWIWNIHKHL